jgi:hypothetical protein
MEAIPDLKESQIQRFYRKFKLNPIVWGSFYCPKHFTLPFTDFHLQLILTALNSRWFAAAAPRGSSKSTLLTFLRPLHAICFDLEPFIVIVSNTYQKAAMALENIKKELRENQSLIADYGIRIRRDAEGDSIFVGRGGNEIRVLCKGAEQIGSIRGEKFGACRPTLILVDDVEDDEMIKNPERRKELQDLYDEALVPSLDFKNGKICVVGTILHDDSQVAKLVSDSLYPEYTKLIFRGLNTDAEGNYFSLWNNKWTVEDLLWIKKNKPDVFAKEIQNDPVAGSKQVFHKEDFRYWRVESDQYVLFGIEGEIVSMGNLSDCKAAIACDLAWSERKEADFSVVMAAFLTPESDLLIDSCIYKRGMRPDEMVEILYSMRDRLKAHTGSYIPIGFEKAMLEKVTKWFLGREGRKRNDPLFFKEVVWDGDKITRIMVKLQPRYAQHMIYHQRSMGELEYQLTRFPSATHDDLCDALQMLTTLLTYPRALKTPQGEDDKFTKLVRFANQKRGKRSFNPSKYPFAKRDGKVEIPAQSSVI